MKHSIYLLLLLVAFCLSGPVYGQTRPPQDSVGVQRLSQDLRIDAALAAQVVNAMRSNQAQIDQLIRNRDIKPAEKQQLFMQLTGEREKKIADLLTDDQFIRFKRLMMNHLQPYRASKSAEIAIMKAKESAGQPKNTN